MLGCLKKINEKFLKKKRYSFYREIYSYKLK